MDSVMQHFKFWTEKRMYKYCRNNYLFLYQKENKIFMKRKMFFIHKLHKIFSNSTYETFTIKFFHVMISIFFILIILNATLSFFFFSN